MKLIISDFDGTLVDTREVNYYAYRDALETFGYTIEYEYYCQCCNGRHYLDFLPQITTNDIFVLQQVHERKKKQYLKYINKARVNWNLVDLLWAGKKTCKIALVTTASHDNVFQLLNEYNLMELFDLILTHEDIKQSKPNPEGYLKAIEFFGVAKQEVVVFEDSSVGIEAARHAGVDCYVVKGYS